MSQIYEPRGRAREYSPLALNYFKGCDHACKYCYVPPMMKRFNTDYKHSRVNISVDYKKIEASARKMQGCGKQILFSFTTDPYTNLENGETRRVLEILNFYGHKVAILTKSGIKVLKDVDIYKKFGDRIKIGQSITFDNDKDSRFWEMGAALPSDRINALRKLNEEGIKTWVSFEPVIIPEQSLNLIKQLAFVDHIKIGKLNNFKGIDKKIDWAKFIKDAVELCREKNIVFYIKKDLAEFNSHNVFLSKQETDMDYLNL